MLLTCKCCKRQFKHKKTGRPPSYCPRCKPYVIEEYQRNYHKTYKRDKKLYNNYHKDYRKLYKPNKRKQTETLRRWALDNWKVIEIDGFIIYVRCDAYSVWWRWKKRKSREYQKQYQNSYRNQSKVRKKQKDYHKGHREKYHRGSDMGVKPKRYPSGDLNLKNERQVINAEFKRLGLKKGRDII